MNNHSQIAGIPAIAGYTRIWTAEHEWNVSPEKWSRAGQFLTQIFPSCAFEVWMTEWSATGGPQCINVELSTKPKCKWSTYLTGREFGQNAPVELRLKVVGRIPVDVHWPVGENRLAEALQQLDKAGGHLALQATYTAGLWHLDGSCGGTKQIGLKNKERMLSTAKSTWLLVTLSWCCHSLLRSWWQHHCIVM